MEKFNAQPENNPDYLVEIDSIRRAEIIDTSAEITRKIPGAIICGGNATRILYEAYTGKTMFGVGKNDSDCYVSRANFEEFLANPPAGYELKHELDENGQEKRVRPKDDYLVLTRFGEHIDIFGTGDLHKSTTVQLDGKNIRVQSLTDQINDKVRMMYEYNGLANMEIDPLYNPDPISKYGVYAQRILEIADSEKGRAEIAEYANELPEDWREIMEVMASQGKYGDQLKPEKREAFLEKMEVWQKQQELMEKILDQTMTDLEVYYEINHSKLPQERDGNLPSLLNGFEGKINEILREASSADDFIEKIIGKMSNSEKESIKDKLRNLANRERCE